VAVAAESAYYNGQQRAAQFGPMRVPLSLTIGSGPMQNGQTDKRGRPVMVLGIQIDIGGGMLVAASQSQPQRLPHSQPHSQPQPLVAGRATGDLRRASAFCRPLRAATECASDPRVDLRAASAGALLRAGGTGASGLLANQPAQP